MLADDSRVVRRVRRTGMGRVYVGAVIAIALVGLTSADSFAGQDSASSPPPKNTGWVFEVHAGGIPNETPSKTRTSQLPAAGPGFLDLAGNPSRQVPSWYFGDGAVLANQVVGQTGDPVHIVPLDPVLTSPSVSRQSAANLGFRIGHTITRRVLLTVSYDSASSQLALTSGALAAIASTNASYKPFWEALLTRPTSANVKSSSTATTVDNVANKERIFSVATDIRIVTVSGWTPYVTVGGGLAFPDAAGPTVTMAGNYQFNFVNPGVGNNGVLLKETDQVQVQFQPLAAPFGILGVGVERDLAAHLGIRADVRAFVGANQLRTRVNAQPASAIPSTPPFAATRRAASPSLEISANPALPSSLSLQGVDRYISYEGIGNLPTFTAGVFVKF